LRSNGKITIVYINDTYADVATPLAGYMRLSSVEKHISDLQELGSNRMSKGMKLH